jgi:hypothetical protein
MHAHGGTAAEIYSLESDLSAIIILVSLLDD